MDHSSQENGSGQSRRPHPNSSAPQNKSSWFKLLFLLVLLGGVSGVIGLFVSGDMVKSVKGHLQKLREDRVTQAYYDFTSKTFQKTTSLEDFREFISIYPVLSENKSFLYEGRSKEDGIGKVSGTLVSKDHHEMKAEYQLVKEDGSWKIQTIRLEEMTRDEEGNPVFEEMAKAVHEQLRMLQRDEVLEAYYAYYSRGFQKDTPYQAFEDYVRSHPILTSFTDIEFKDRRIVGATGIVNLELSSDSGDYHLEYKLKREKGDWKVWSLRLILPPEEAAKKVATDPESLVPPVRTMLDALLLDNIEGAYFSTSREFQESTSLSSFETFVHTYPVLLDRDLTDIKSGQIDNGAGSLRVNLHDDVGMTVLEFKLGYDEGQWKVWGIKVLDNPYQVKSEATPPSGAVLDKESLAEQLINVVEDYLHTLMHQDVVRAYYSLSSQQFREKRDLAAFEEMIAANPMFSLAKGTELKTMRQNGKVIVLKGTLDTIDFKRFPVQYELIQEEGRWKIHDFALRETAGSEIAQADIAQEEEEEIAVRESEDIDVPYTDIKKITIGDEVDGDGIIKTPRIVIDAEANLIFFNVQIEDGIADSLVTLFLSHVDSGTTAPPLSTKLKEDGVTTISFSYAAPTGGWPEGNYLAKVTTNTGDEHIQGFQIRKGEKKFY